MKQTKLVQTAIFSALVGLGVQGVQAMTYTTGANSMPQGDAQAHATVTWGEGKRQGSYSSQQYKLGYDRGLSDQWDLGLALNAYAIKYSGSPVPGELDGSGSLFKLSGVQAHAKKTLIPAQGDQMGVALMGLLKYDSVDKIFGESISAIEFEGKIITQQGFLDGRVQWVNNAQLEVERDGSDAAMTTRLRSALSYKLNSNWTAGIEGFWDYEVIKEEGEWVFDHWDLFAGPLVAYNDKTWRAAFTLMPQLMGSDERDTGKTGLHLADHEKVNARLVVARKF